MPSDPRNYFGFLVDEISESGHNISLNTYRTIRRKPNSKYSLNEFQLKASFKPIESI